MAVFVLDKKHKPLMPCSEKRARLLLTRRRARVHTMYPFTIRLIDRKVEDSVLQPVRFKIDPGSKTSGIAIVQEKDNQQSVLFLAELTHRGSSIRDHLNTRAQMRRHRRYFLKYRSKRFSNRRRKEGWLAPSLYHRIENIETWIKRFQKRVSITAITCERVRFDTQKLLHPEIEGIEYQQGTLFGYEVREYLLEKWGRKCAYCDRENIPLEIDHIIPRSSGGSNRIDNLTLACRSCNIKKGNQSVETFSPKRAKAILSKRSLQGAAGVNSTRNALWQKLLATSLPCEGSTGGKTKYNRERMHIPKGHALDAACTGSVDHLSDWQIPIFHIISTGRGAYQRTRLDQYGFPRGYLMRQKKVNGFRTGDLITAKVPSGKKEGVYKGRVQVRASGYFNIQTSELVVQGINSKYCKLLQRADGYNYFSETSVVDSNQKIEERQFPPVINDWVSLPSMR